jgi:hypothetical protein
MPYPLKKLFSLTLTGVALLSCLACHSRDDKSEKSEYQILEAPPLKLKRSQFGFVREKFLADYDFQNGTVQYSLSYSTSEQPACEGTYDFSNEKDRWIDAVSNLKLCRKQMEISQSDSKIDVIELFFPRDSQFSDQIRSTEQDGYIMVDFYPEPNLATGGNQQFLCDGKFPLDQMLKDAVDCL